MAASMERSKDPYEMGFLIAPRVPQGLAAVVESLTREVLRQRPEDIYVFAARHFEKLLTLREQYDVEKTTRNEYNFCKTIGRRNECKEPRKSKSMTKDIATGSGWSLNETAKVLERHRNIFGDGEKRISTEEVRALAKERKGRTSSSTKNKRDKKRSSNVTQEYTRDHARTTTESNDNSSKLDRSAKTLKIISQIPMVLTRNSGTKDIKMELRKNRLSGSLREKSTDSSNDGQLPERTGDMSRKSLGKAERAELIQKFEEERICKKERERRSESVERNSSQSGRTRRRKGSFSEVLLDRNELPKTRSMDQVKEYVVRSFGSTRNVDELDLDYVGRVQEVIDRNVPIIKEKIEDLKRRENLTDVDNRVTDRSISSVERPRKRGSRPSTSENDGRRSIENQESYRSKRSSSVDSTVSRGQRDDTLEARLISTQNILQNISSMCHPKTQTSVHRPKSSNGHSNDQENEYSTSEGDSKIILPAVRPSSSRSSRSLSRNDSDNLILPPISPDTGKISKRKNGTTLPALSPVPADNSSSSSSRRLDEKENNSTNDKSIDLGKEIVQLSTSIKEDISSTRKILEGVNDAFQTLPGEDKNELDEETSSTRDTTNVKEEEVTIIRETIENPVEDSVFDQKTLDVIQVEEVFKDSLNVTPDIVDAPQRPDSLEPLIEDERPTTGDSHLSTVDEGNELKQKLMEIQEMERNVGKAIDSFEDTREKEEIRVEELEKDKATKEEEKEAIKEEESEATKEGENETTKEEEKEAMKEEDNETTKETSDTSRLEEEPPTDVIKTVEDTNGSSSPSPKESEKEPNHSDTVQVPIADDEPTKTETGRSEMSKSDTENVNEPVETYGELEIEIVQDSPLSLKEEEEEEKDSPNVSLDSASKEVPFSYILTEGSPVEIPDFVTTVIIPDRPPSTPELDFENKMDVELREERRKRAVESFGEYIRPEPIECSTVDIDFIRGIKAGHDIAIVRQDLDGIKEEEEDDEEKRSKLTDEVSKKDTKKDHTPVLEHISENEEVEENDESNKTETKIVPHEQEDVDVKIIVESEENPIDVRNDATTEISNVVEISLEGEESTETADVTTDSTNEVKETTITDRSTDSLSLDPARPIVPELNLDSLRDITISSFKMNDVDATASVTEPMSSEKEKVEENIEIRQEVNSENGQGRDDTSAMETISMDEKPGEVEPPSTDLEGEETKKEETTSSMKEIVGNEEERSVASAERNTEPVLPENVEQRDTIKSVSSPRSYLGLEENAADLDTEEEIAKELIEIDRAENPPTTLQETRVTLEEDRKEDKPGETLDSNGAKDEVVSTSVEINIKEEEGKADSVVTSPVVESPAVSAENLQEVTSTKGDDEIISGGVESRRSSGNEEGKDRSNGSPENNERSDTSVAVFGQEEVKELDVVDTKLGEKKEYHIYVTDLKPKESQDDDTRSSSTTFHSAATKIQAGIRGFLIRKKLQESRQGSTLDGVPSIKESSTDEPSAVDVKSKSEIVPDSPVETTDSSTARSEKVTTSEEKENIPLARTVSMLAKSRQCLRREDAMQRNTLSTENAFASSGVQHTGEFHDCLPLPVLESIEIPRNTALSRKEEEEDEGSTMEEESIDRKIETPRDESPIDSPTNLSAGSKEHDGYETIENIDPTPVDFVQDLNNLLGGLHPKDFAKLLMGQARTPFMVGLIDVAPDPVLGTSPNVIFETNANLNVNDDRTRSAKDESTLHNRYLNFITSVEDSELSHVKNTIEEYKDRSGDHSMQSLLEPLALPGTPEGLVIEELSSLDSTTLSKLQDASFNPTSLESAMMDHESLDKSVMDSEKSTEYSEKSNGGDPLVRTTSKDEETEDKDKQSAANESVSSPSAKTPASTISDESDERAESSKSRKEDGVERDPVIETKNEKVSQDDTNQNTNVETIERETPKSLSPETKESDSGRNEEFDVEAKEETKGDEIIEDKKDNDTKEETIVQSTVESPSETKEIETVQIVQPKVTEEVSEDDKSNDVEETIERSTIKSPTSETKDIESDQDKKDDEETKGEDKSDQISEEDKNNNATEEVSKRSTAESPSSEIKEVDNDPNAESVSGVKKDEEAKEVKEDKEDEEDKEVKEVKEDEEDKEVKEDKEDKEVKEDKEDKEDKTIEEEKDQNSDRSTDEEISSSVEMSQIIPDNSVKKSSNEKVDQ